MEDSDSSDGEFKYEAVTVGAESENEDLDEDLQTALQNLGGDKSGAAVTAAAAVAPTPRTEKKSEPVDDFLRNYLLKMGLHRTLETFQTEWYERQHKGLLKDQEMLEGVTDVYQQNQLLLGQVQTLLADMDKLKQKSSQMQEALAKSKKERDFHRMHHKRLGQEKNKLLMDLHRANAKSTSHEPELEAMRNRFESSHRELMITRNEKHNLQKKVEELNSSLKEVTEQTAKQQLQQSQSQSQPQSAAITPPPSAPQQQPTSPANNTRRSKGAKSGSRMSAARESARGVGTSKMATASLNSPKRVHHPQDRELPAENRSNPWLSAESFQRLLVPDGAAYRNTKTTRAHTLPISSICLHPRRPLAVTVSDDTTFKVWSLPDCEVCVTGDGHKDWIADCAFHPSGAFLATASGDTTVKVWNLTKQFCSATFTDHTQVVWGCVFHDTGDFLASCSMDGTTKLFDLHSQRCRQTFRGHDGSVNYLAFQPFTNVLCTCSVDKALMFWDVRSADCLKILRSHTNACNHVCFNLRGDVVASTDADGVVKIWDLRTVTERQSINAGPFPANKAAFDHTASTVFVPSDDGAIKVFNVNDGKLVAELKGHEEAVQAVQMVPPPVADVLGAPLLLSVSSDTTLRTWSPI
eukprot:TRINITY_DN6927_c0_g1_i1.p1 TRINITY_DN6927_c0_g1~~TRINITY_DN6927_c0_g1_i1.p1  ORF type:complete len:713 (-),score=182.73 TRINITY_DN6927_c0_g1_i1:91-1998(-)